MTEDQRVHTDSAPAIPDDTPSGEKVSSAPGDVLSRLAPDQQVVLRQLIDAFRAQGRALYLVGGSVRDILFERPGSIDLDLSTDAVPQETRDIAQGLPAIGLYDVGERFGTIGVVFSGADRTVAVEITTFRSERYEPGNRHPAVAYSSSIEDDLARRDFTVNAIAVDTQTGEFHDPFDGQADLAMGMLRAVGDPVERFREDPLRLLRAARFVSQLGFTVDSRTRAAIASEAPSLRAISRERVLMELTKMLCGEYADHGLELLLETGLLTIAMPELLPLERAAHGHPGMHREKDLWSHTKRVVVQSPARPAVRWAALLHDAAKPLTRSVDASGGVHFFGHERVGADIAARLLARLGADNQTRKVVRQLVDLHLRPASYDPRTWTDSAVRRLALEADGVLHDLLELAAADVTSAQAQKQHAAAARVQGLRDHIARLEGEVALAHLQSPLDGNELMMLFDRTPGKWIAEIKDHLREMVIDGDLAPGDKATATSIARQMLVDRGEPRS